MERMVSALRYSVCYCSVEPADTKQGVCAHIWLLIALQLVSCIWLYGSPYTWPHTAVTGVDRTRSPPPIGLGGQEGRLLLLGGLRLLVRRDEL